MDLVACPPTSQLVQFRHGEIPDALAASLSKHIRDCDSCSKSLDQLSGSVPSTASAETPVGRPETLSLQDQTPGWEAPPSYLSSSEVDFLAPATGPDELGWLAQYRVLKVLGKGGMGIVLLAEDTELQRPVALKVMRPELGQDAEMRAAFLA